MCFNLQLLCLYDLGVDRFHSWFLFFSFRVNLSCLNIVPFHEPSHIHTANLFMTRSNAELFALRDRMNSFSILTSANFREDFNLAHLNAVNHVLLGDYKSAVKTR